MANSIFGITIALICAMSWAICSLLFKKLGQRLDSISLTTIKAILSSVLLFILALLSGLNIEIDTKNILLIAFSGIVGIAIGDSLFFASLNRLSPIILSILLFLTPNLFSGIFGFVFLGEMPSLISWIGIFLILLGLSFLIFPVEDDGDNTKTKISGVVFAILSVICTTYSVALVKPILQEYPTITVTMYRMFFSAIALMIFVILSKRIKTWKNVLSDKKYSLKLSGTIAIVTFGGFWLSLVAIKYCKLIVASSLMSLEPLFILIFMVLFYKYRPKMKEYLGIIISVFGIITLCLR